MNIEEIKAEAKRQLVDEQFQAAVDKYKEKLKKAKWTDKLFPWKIVVIKKDQV